MYYVFMQMLSSGPAWLSIILLITISLLPDVIKKVLCRAVCPTATERAQVSDLFLFFYLNDIFIGKKNNNNNLRAPALFATASCDIIKGWLRDLALFTNDV